MATYNNSVNMSLPIPVVGNDPGPDYALNIDNCLTIIDSHDHSTGKGVQVTPAGLNISSDLTFNGNNATAVRSTRFLTQGAPLSLSSDLGCLYVSGVDLYYNDENGNQIRMTQGGSVSGPTGSITGLAAPASVSYSSSASKFTFQADVSSAAYLDAASITIRNTTPSANGVTLAPISSLASNYTLVLPAVPSTTSFLSLDSSGNMITTVNSTNSDPVGQAMTSVGANAIGSTMGSTGANAVATSRTRAVSTSGSDPGAGGVVFSNISLTGVTSTSFTTVGSVTLTTSGRPVVIMVVPWTNVSAAGSILVNGPGSPGGATTKILRGSYAVGLHYFQNVASGQQYWPPGIISAIDTPSAGTYTFTLQANVSTGGQSITFNTCNLVAYEL